LLRGLPAAPQPAADFLLVHNRAVYLVIAPGSQLAPDQRRALSGLHFTPHASSFPVQPHLGVQPNPVNLGKKLRVTLIAVQPGVRYTFAIRPGKPGFGGGNMGARRSNIIGGVSFTYPPFRDRRDSGQWTMTAYNRNGQKVATTTVIVRATPCCAKDSRQKKTD
jgi:hypothetical protein